jgi:hypothetical protein
MPMPKARGPQGAKAPKVNMLTSYGATLIQDQLDLS